MNKGIEVNTETVKHAFMESGATYCRISEDIGIDRRHLSDIVNGKQTFVRPDTLRRLSMYFGIPVNDLMKTSVNKDIYEISEILKHMSYENVALVREYIDTLNVSNNI